MCNVLTQIFEKGRPFLCPLLALRLGVAWFFYQSALIKVTQVLPWPEISQTTFSLFESYYKVPVLDPKFAAILGTWTELILPILLLLGLMTRFTALGLFGFNIIAYLSLPEANAAAVVEHLVVYNLMILAILFHGAGRVSLDHFVCRSRDR